MSSSKIAAAAFTSDIRAASPVGRSGWTWPASRRRANSMSERVAHVPTPNTS
jgi:hypothetical protein